MSNSLESHVLEEDVFNDLLRMQKVNQIKSVSRSCSNNYKCGKTEKQIKRKETTAEHVLGCIKLSDYLLLTFPEFRVLHYLRADIYSLFTYHDDVEIDTGDENFSNKEGREEMEKMEIEAMPGLIQSYPTKLSEALDYYDSLFRYSSEDFVALVKSHPFGCRLTLPEINKIKKFGEAVDRLEPLIHELIYPGDWGADKGYGPEDIRGRLEPYLAHSLTFQKILNSLILYMEKDSRYF